jgi:CHAT domain-containing protein
MNHFGAGPDASFRNFLGIAPMQYSTNLNIGSLPGSDHSVRTVQSYFGNADHLIGEAATKNNFMRQFYNYKVIQLYTHASEKGAAGEPVIYFSDSSLYLSDLITGAKPATSLIVLSACETGTGKLYQGEGVFSFSRGFAALGIPSSINNLWAVDDQSTYRITELFYKYLARGMDIDIALQKAKIEFVQTSSMENKLAYYWAAPVLTGKTDAIEFKKAFSWKYILLDSVIIIIIITIVALRKSIKIKNRINLTPDTMETVS